MSDPSSILVIRVGTPSLTLAEKRWLNQRPASVKTYWLPMGRTSVESVGQFMVSSTGGPGPHVEITTVSQFQLGHETND